MRIRTALAIGLLLVLGVAGCGRGGDQDDGVATAGGPAKPSASATGTHDPKQDQEAFLAYAKCMREHGVPMDDPQMDGGAVQMTIPEGTAKEKVEAADKECKHLMPNGGQPPKPNPEDMEKMRKFAQCMREHGLPDFPDPSDDGGIQIDGNTSSIDPRSETFKKAEQECQQYQPKPPGGADGGDGGPNTRTGGGA